MTRSTSLGGISNQKRVFNFVTSIEDVPPLDSDRDVGFKERVCCVCLMFTLCFSAITASAVYLSMMN